MSDGKYRSGKYHPRYPDKYLGDINNITYRSSWEFRAFSFLDGNKNVLTWGSEIIPIPYQKPVIMGNGVSLRPARYFPDLYVEYLHVSGAIIKELIEIKPLKQTKKSRSRKTSVKLQEDFTFVVNKCKWEAAKAWCDHHGIGFRLATENEIFKMR